MTKIFAAASAALALAAPAFAAEPPAPAHAVGADVTYSSDADQTEMVRVGVNGNLAYRDEEHYLGFRIERTWYRPNGALTKRDDRVYVLAAGGSDWKYALQLGTNGDTVLGSGSVHNEARLRQEYFVERDRLETPQGATRGLYYTFGGASVDLPFSDRAQLTLLGGLQEFTGRNVRTHLRANAIAVVAPDWGLSLQLRTRYFHDSVPYEYDYYSPRWYAEVLPVVQVRRFIGGWRLLAAAGWGAHKDSVSDWRQSRYLNLRATSPTDRRGWAMKGDLTYSNQPVTNASNYDYLRVSAGLTRVF
ncbi:hypothetical protein ABDK56_12115 [Sphingomonas sp. ASV193]|uniref:hypothetical protein n=1 Tax=Sphingomonas sp. ASV193 TaxID=3144405 RepID=UPI0032E88B73